MSSTFSLYHTSWAIKPDVSNMILWYTEKVDHIFTKTVHHFLLFHEIIINQLFEFEAQHFFLFCEARMTEGTSSSIQWDSSEHKPQSPIMCLSYLSPPMCTIKTHHQPNVCNCAYSICTPWQLALHRLVFDKRCSCLEAMRTLVEVTHLISAWRTCEK